jgi:hypothetical protein
MNDALLSLGLSTYFACSATLRKPRTGTVSTVRVILYGHEKLTGAADRAEDGQNNDFEITVPY